MTTVAVAGDTRLTLIDQLADAVLEAFILRRRDRFELLQRLRFELAARASERAA